MAEVTPLWESFRIGWQLVLDLPLREYGLAIWLYDNGADRAAWTVPHTGTHCEYCGREWAELQAAFISHCVPLEEPKFLHRCRIAQTSEQMSDPGDEEPACSLDRQDPSWEVACVKAHPRQVGPSFNGMHCVKCDYTLQVCRFHRWASLEGINRCRSCLRDYRLSKVITIRTRVPGVGNGPATVSACFAIDGALLSVLEVAFPENTMPGAFQRIWSIYGDSIATWLQYLHNQVIKDCSGTARILTDGSSALVSERPELSVGRFPYPEYPLDWAVSGLRTFRITLIVEIQRNSHNFPQEHLRKAAQLIACDLAEAVTTGHKDLASRIRWDCLSYAGNYNLG